MLVLSKHEVLRTATSLYLDFDPRLPILITKYYLVLNVLNISRLTGQYPVVLREKAFMFLRDTHEHENAIFGAKLGGGFVHLGYENNLLH